MTSQLDNRLEKTFASLGSRFNRTGLFKRAAVMAGALVGYGAATESAGAVSLCANTFGACGGSLCCGCYNGCKCIGSQYFCGDRPNGCYVTTAKWTRCCNSYYLYEWFDCGFLVIGSNACCNDGGSPSASLGCSTCANVCGQAYVDCYRCTFRNIISGGC